MREAVVVDVLRTPVGRAGDRGIYRDISVIELEMPVVKTILKKNRLDPKLIDDAVWCTVFMPTRMARSFIFEADLPETIGVVVCQRMCASSLQGIAIAAGNIAMNTADIVLVVGADTDQRVQPVPPDFGARGAASQPRLDRPSQREGPLPEGWKNAKLLPQFDTKVAPWIWNMGMTAERLAEVYKVTRQEADEFSYKSQMKVARAYKEGKYQDHIVPVTIEYEDGTSVTIDKDQCPRADTTMEALAKLKPVFKEDGQVTAGNACPRNDGASAAIIMSKDKARELGYKPLATVKSYAMVGVDPHIMGIGPVPATQRLLKRVGMTVKDIDLFELNEAFGCQGVIVQRELKIPEEKLNVNGGAIAIGHPFGVTGNRLVAQLTREMARRDVQFGVVTLCVGGGQGFSMLLEREHYDWA